MPVRYINTDTPNVVKVVAQPQPPAPQRPAAPAVNLPAIGAKKAALQQELNAVQTAEQQRINAELEAARKQNLLRAEIAELEAAEREAAVGQLTAQAQRVTEGSAGNVSRLYAELEPIVDALENITSDVNMKAAFDHFASVAEQALAHALPNTFDYQTARAAAGAVLGQCGQPPVTLVPALKQWIAATKNPQQRQIRAGITLALVGIVFRDVDLPALYDARDESAELLRAQIMPRM